VTWALLDWCKHKKPTTLGMITGMIAGLAAVTPAAGYITPMSAICIGIGAGVIPWFAVTYIKALLGYDDTLDALAHVSVGSGVIATGFRQQGGRPGPTACSTETCLLWCARRRSSRSCTRSWSASHCSSS
jgi:ammonia channel protein AmtB